MHRPLTALLTVTALAAASGCGSGEDPPPARGGTVTIVPGDGAARPPAPPGGGRGLPAGVPTRAERTGASAEQRRVVDGWLAALRAGRTVAAADFFAARATVQNGTPVLTLDSAAERRAFNDAFPCGARAERYGTSGDYVVVEYRLTERRGGNCQGAAGMPARGVVRVRAGRITEWYRLPDDPAADPSTPPDEPKLDLDDAGDA